MSYFFRKDQFSNLVDEIFLTHTIRHFSNYNTIAAILALLNIRYRPNCYRTAPSLVRFMHWSASVHFRACRKVGTFNMRQKLIQCNIRIIYLRHCRVNYFTKIVRRDIRRHTNSNTHLPIQQNIWYSSRQNNRLFLCPVKVIAKINRFFLNIGQ